MASTKELKVKITVEDEASKKLGKLGSSVKTIGKSMVALGIVATGVLVGIAKSAIEFEDTFAGVRKTVDLSEKGFKDLSDRFRQISRTTPIAIKELNSIGEIAGQLGVSGVDDLEKFTKTIADIAVSTNLTSEVAATSFARISNIMKEPIENVDRMGSAIVDLGNNFATTETEIVTFANRIAGAGKISGMTTADILGIGAAFSSVGVQAERGGTAVSKTLFKMTEAVTNSTDDLATFADVAGLSMTEFSDLFEKDAVQAFDAFISGLGEVGIKGVALLDDLGLGDQRLLQSFISVAGAGDLMTNAIDKSNQAFKANTALTIEATKRYRTTASQLQILKNNLNDVGIVLGAAVLPALNTLIASLIPAIQGFSRFAEQHPKMIVGLLGVVSALGMLSATIFVLSPIVGALTTVFTSTAAAAVGTTLAAISLTSVLAGVFVGVTALLTGFVALAGVIDLAAIATGRIDSLSNGLTARFGNLIDKTMQLKRTTKNLEEANNNLVTSMDKVNNAQRLLTESDLRLEGAQLRVERAQNSVNDALNTFGDDSLEHREALYQLQIANNDLKVAEDLVTTATEELTVATGEQDVALEESDVAMAENQKVLGEQETALIRVSNAWNSVKDSIRSAIAQAKEWISGDYSSGNGGGSWGGENDLHGGVIPGAFNQPVPAILHGGERVIPRNGVDVNSGGSSEGVTINFNGSIGIRDDSDIQAIANAVKSVIDREDNLFAQGVL